MNKCYFLHCQITDLSIAEKGIRFLHDEVKSASNGDYKIVGAGGNKGSFTILFSSDLDQATLAMRLKAGVLHGVNYTTFEISQFLGGHIETGVLEWLSRHQLRAKKL